MNTRYDVMGYTTLMIAACMSAMACQDITAKLPAGAVDPEYYQTAEAADRMARNARYEFQVQLLAYLQNSGGISDELRWRYYGDPVGSWDLEVAIDSRQVPEEGIPALNRGLWDSRLGGYDGLQRVRSLTLQARSALLHYAPNSAPSLRGEMLAYEAYTAIMLADLFCSGVPLTTVDFEGDITYRPGSRTRDIYLHAIALFDSAITISHDDVRIERLARIGKGRALMALGQPLVADTIVAAIPDGYQFTVSIVGRFPSQSYPNGYDWIGIWGPGLLALTDVSDHEGRNGLPFLSAKDPRIVVSQPGHPSYFKNRNGIPNWIPAPRTQLVVAGYLEARLIQAEAALNAGQPAWLDILNTLRTNRTWSRIDTATIVDTTSEGGMAHIDTTVRIDTLWNAGTGGVPRLGPLDDPANRPIPPGSSAKDIRLDLIFRERAFWLFVTGHRQGDLRRLIRNYGRTVETTYPYGVYRGGSGSYGVYIDLPIPSKERFNPYFTGCLGRGE